MNWIVRFPDGKLFFLFLEWSTKDVSLNFSLTAVIVSIQFHKHIFSQIQYFFQFVRCFDQFFSFKLMHSNSFFFIFVKFENRRKFVGKNLFPFASRTEINFLCRAFAHPMGEEWGGEEETEKKLCERFNFVWIWCPQMNAKYVRWLKISIAKWKWILFVSYFFHSF